MSKKKQPEWICAFGGVFSASASVSCISDKTCAGFGFAIIFAILSMAAFQELFDRIKEERR